MPYAEFIDHLRRYRCILKAGGRHGQIYYRKSTRSRQFIPRCDEISAKLAMRICDALEIVYPESLREKQSPNFSQSFDEAVQSLIDQGYSPIRKLRFHMHTYDPPKKHNLKSETYPSAVSYEYELLEKDDLAEGEFWIPVGFDGFRFWEKEACAPDWITNKTQRTKWVKKFWRESQWPDHGERSEDPTRFVNSELGILQCDLEGSSEVSQKHRIKLRDKLQELGVIGAQYLAESIELALKVGGVPDHQQIKSSQLLDHSAVSPYVSKDITRIIELAYRAGRVQATQSAYYRGVPYMAQDGAPTALQAGKGRPKADKVKKKPKLRKWQKDVGSKVGCGLNYDRRDLLEDLVKKGAIFEDSPGVYREAETAKGGTTFSYETFRRKLARFFSSEKKRTV
jgi:hypothetical protein